MGTAREWFLVLVVGFLFSGSIGLLTYYRPKFFQPSRIYWKLVILDNTLFGLLFGVMEVFRGSRPFRPPLVYLNVGIVVCMLPVTYSLRRVIRNLPRLPKKPALFPVPDFSRAEKKPDANDAT
jgi:hypothetical protein